MYMFAAVRECRFWILLVVDTFVGIDTERRFLEFDVNVRGSTYE